MIPSNKVTWFQLPADDEQRAWYFYGQIFGWSQEEVYANKTTTGAINGEIVRRSGELKEPRLVIRVDDVDGMIERIIHFGGKIIRQRTEITEIGMVYASFEDTEGNAVNIVGNI
ncbi:VOC family protein [Paenibacillus cellulositrophicus]|uniref:VOC family protein n=1 Tax=Paenibacillus cellulositrophicus TaxID=562959 RepID=UPI003D98EBF4